MLKVINNFKFLFPWTKLGMFKPLHFKTLISLMLVLYVSIWVHQLLYSFLQRHHLPKDAYPVTGESQHFWPTLSGLFGHGTSGKDRQHTSFASSRRMSSFYLRVYSGFYCRTQIPSGAFSLQPSSSIIFSYNQPVRWYYKDI